MLNPQNLISRRGFSRATLVAGSALLLPVSEQIAAQPRPAAFRIARFAADVTIPLGHGCMGGGISPAKVIVDPLQARGFVILGADKPIVFVSVDWCEIRNDAYQRWRDALADAAGTDSDHVLVSSIHQHDAPVADLTAEKLLRGVKSKGSICDPEFHELAVQRVARALRESLQNAEIFDQVGAGEARVDRVSSNRRYWSPEGRPTFGRASATRDAYARSQPEGTIDTMLKTLSFWNGDQCLCEIHFYAVHPMSYYGKGQVSSDFPGLARSRRQGDDAAIFQIYASGCSGNVTAGKHNDGSIENRPLLADRLYQAMVASRKATQRKAVSAIQFRRAPLGLEPRNSAGFSKKELEERLRNAPRPFDQCLAAMGLSWLERHRKNPTIDVPAIDFGNAQLLLLPGESYVEYQLFAQRVRNDQMIFSAGYGESATGYVPTEKAFEENDSNLSDWCWVAPGCEAKMKAAIVKVLSK